MVGALALIIHLRHLVLGSMGIEMRIMRSTLCLSLSMHTYVSYFTIKAEGEFGDQASIKLQGGGPYATLRTCTACTVATAFVSADTLLLLTRLPGLPSTGLRVRGASGPRAD